MNLYGLGKIYYYNNGDIFISRRQVVKSRRQFLFLINDHENVYKLQ